MPPVFSKWTFLQRSSCVCVLWLLRKTLALPNSRVGPIEPLRCERRIFARVKSISPQHSQKWCLSRERVLSSLTFLRRRACCAKFVSGAHFIYPSNTRHSFMKALCSEFFNTKCIVEEFNKSISAIWTLIYFCWSDDLVRLYGKKTNDLWVVRKKELNSCWRGVQRHMGFIDLATINRHELLTNIRRTASISSSGVHIHV